MLPIKINSKELNKNWIKAESNVKFPKEPKDLLVLKKEINSDYVEIWGEGSARRSFIYATDVCNFIGSIVNDFELFPQDYILTGKNNYSVLEYNKIIAEQIAYKGSFQFNLDKPVGYKKRLICSKHKSYSVFYTPIEQSISEVYEFYLKEVCK
jgi:GDP-L-fucose synthase